MELAPLRTRRGPGLARVQDEVYDVFRRLFGDWQPSMPVGGTHWPAVDIVEDENSLTVKAELPGMVCEDIKVSVLGNTLSISGEKKEQVEEDKAGHFLSERRFGSFRRDLVLPADVDTEKVEAAYKRGVLIITIPKSEVAKAKQVEIKPWRPDKTHD